MLPTTITSISEVTTLEDFRGELVLFAQRLGFRYASAMAVVDRPSADSYFATVENVPPNYGEWSSDRQAASTDPVMQHCKRSTVPIAWSQATYVNDGSGAKWESQAVHGFRYGIAWAMHLPGGRHFVLGVDGEDRVPDRFMESAVADLCLFATYALQSAEHLLFNPGSATSELSARELESLHWTKLGKTAAEVGLILGISERTVVKHLRGAMHKLGCSSKHQAVLLSVEAGLLEGITAGTHKK